MNPSFESASLHVVSYDPKSLHVCAIFLGSLMYKRGHRKGLLYHHMGIFLNLRNDGVISGRIPSKPSEEVGEAWQLAIEVYSNLCLGTPNFWWFLRMALLFSPFVFYGLSFGKGRSSTYISWRLKCWGCWILGFGGCIHVIFCNVQSPFFSGGSQVDVVFLSRKFMEWVL